MSTSNEDKSGLLESLIGFKSDLHRMVDAFFHLPDFARDAIAYLREQLAAFGCWLHRTCHYLGEVASNLCQIALFAITWLSVLIIPPAINFVAFSSFFLVGVAYIGLYLSISYWGLKRRLRHAKPRSSAVKSLPWSKAEVPLE